MDDLHKHDNGSQPTPPSHSSPGSLRPLPHFTSQLSVALPAVDTYCGAMHVQLTQPMSIKGNFQLRFKPKNSLIYFQTRILRQFQSHDHHKIDLLSINNHITKDTMRTNTSTRAATINLSPRAVVANIRAR